MKEKEIKVKLIEEPQVISVNGKSYKVIIEEIEDNLCICGCGKPRSTKISKYATSACRTRVYRRKLKMGKENS